MKILFFIEALGFGGKERRLMELIHYLRQNTDYEMAIVLTEDRIHYNQIYDLGVPIKIIKRGSLKRDPGVFGSFYQYCKEFRPNIIHTWGFMTTFYAIPARIGLKIPLISSMITVARREFKEFSLNGLFFRLSCFFSDAIISNSAAGLRAFKVKSKKAKVIYNGVRPDRFSEKVSGEGVRECFGITTTFIVVMVATFSRFKDYDFFLDVAKAVSKNRNDITFLGIGGGPDWDRINKRVSYESIDNVVLPGRRSDVENIITASDIGLLCTYSEGISNSVIEYMAMAKPVIVTDITGGSRELVIDGITGYCTERNVDTIVSLIDRLTNDPRLADRLGQKGKQRIGELFSIERMGKEFVDLYQRYGRVTNH